MIKVCYNECKCVTLEGGIDIPYNSKINVITPINILVCVLAFVGGWINIIGYNLFMHTRPSSMTGRAAEIGEKLGEGDMVAFLYLVLVVVLFIFGVISSTIITQRFGFTEGLVFVSIILVLNILLIKSGQNLKFFNVLLSMAMGAQNGATSLTSIDRTTHMSGATTELGINIAFKNWNKVIFWGVRWIFYPLGAFIAYKFLKWIKINNFDETFTLIIPIIILLGTAFIQKKFINIPILRRAEIARNKQMIT